MRTIRVGLSPCPNDTFLFHALLEGLVEVPGLRFEPVFDDVEALNQRAERGELEVTKASFHAYGHLRHAYRLLASGAALGRGCGPLLVERADAPRADLSTARVAIPGRWTSAALLLRLWMPGLDPQRLEVMTFDRILRAVATGDAEAGLIIHESRFTYHEHGLRARQDLGLWWEETRGLPIPLGGILARRSLDEETFRRIERGIRRSVVHARAHPESSRAFVREHAQELSDDVTSQHIGLYVNDFTVDLGDEGRRAVDDLLHAAEEAGIVPSVPSAGD